MRAEALAILERLGHTDAAAVHAKLRALTENGPCH